MCDRATQRCEMLDADGQVSRSLRPLPAAVISYHIAYGTGPGQKELPSQGDMPSKIAARTPQCAVVKGFHKNAAVAVEANDRKQLEQLCR